MCLYTHAWELPTGHHEMHRHRRSSSNVTSHSTDNRMTQPPEVATGSGYPGHLGTAKRNSVGVFDGSHSWTSLRAVRRLYTYDIGFELRLAKSRFALDETTLCCIRAVVDRSGNETTKVALSVLTSCSENRYEYFIKRLGRRNGKQAMSSPDLSNRFLFYLLAALAVHIVPVARHVPTSDRVRSRRQKEPPSHRSRPLAKQTLSLAPGEAEVTCPAFVANVDRDEARARRREEQDEEEIVFLIDGQSDHRATEAERCCRCCGGR